MVDTAHLEQVEMSVTLSVSPPYKTNIDHDNPSLVLARQDLVIEQPRQTESSSSWHDKDV